jgi:predicted permease
VSLMDLFSLQGTLFMLMLVGAFLKRRGVITAEGKTCLSDLCMNLVIPCNIFKSFLIRFDGEIFHSCALLLLSAVLMQAVCLILNQFVYRRIEPQRRKVLQYCTIVPMSGFLGNPIAEGIYDSIGVMYTSIYLIPMRIVMWSMGTSYFVADEKINRRKVLRNIALHPCLVAIYLGLFFMVTQWPLPRFLTETVRFFGNCNTALTMLIVGTILADVQPRELLDRTAFGYSGLRLLLLPAVAFILGRLLHLGPIAHGISVLMTGMPAGATAAIFAARYHSDAVFATKCVILSTLFSMITLPVWCYLVG